MIPIINTPIIPLMDNRHRGNDCYIKRDDLQPFSLGGNKVRIADEFLENMKIENCDTLIMYGDVRSNLCRVLANACEIYDIPCYMICTDAEKNHMQQEVEGLQNISVKQEKGNNAMIMEGFHVEIVPCEKDKIAITVKTLMESLKSKGRRPYYIYGNELGTGREHIAARAYQKAYEEIVAYEMEHNIQFDYIFHASGTGATQTGLLCGMLMKGHQRNIVGISISRDKQRGSNIIAKGIEDYFSNGGIELPGGYEDLIILEDAYCLGGYGKTNEELLEFVEEQFLNNGIPFDPTYTGKALLGMEKYLKENNIKNKKVLFIHTGGLPLFFDFMQSKRSKKC